MAEELLPDYSVRRLEIFERLSLNRPSPETLRLRHLSIQLAEQVLAAMPLPQRRALLARTLDVFVRWKWEEGVSPPMRAGVLPGGIFAPGAQARAKNAKSKNLFRNKQPWECCDYVTSPIGLFLNLVATSYQPLEELLARRNPALVMASLITYSAKNNEWLADCQALAMHLSMFQLERQRSRINSLRPLASKETHRRKMVQLKAAHRQDQRLKEVYEAYLARTKNGRPRALLINIALDLGWCESKVSKHLKLMGISLR